MTKWSQVYDRCTPSYLHRIPAKTQTDFSQTGEHQATDDRDELQKIDDDLRAASEPGFNSDGRRYIPMDALQSIMCTKRIRAALSPISTEMTTQELASTIVPLLVDELDELRVIRSYQKIFAILILIGKHTAIEQFVVNNVYDDRLPITWSRKDDGHRKNDSRRKNDGRRKTDGRIKNDGPPWERFSNDALDSVGRAVECLGDWKPVDKEIFERTQWRLLAPSFTEGFHHPLKCEQPLPFMMIKDSEQYGTPQYSADFGHEHPITPGLNEDSETIVKIRIHRAHHTFPTYTVRRFLTASMNSQRLTQTIAEGLGPESRRSYQAVGYKRPGNVQKCARHHDTPEQIPE